MAVITSNSITFIDNTGVEKYLYIRYSNDGVTFTGNNGLTPGEWLGTCTTNSTTAPVNFSDYTWSKIKGQDGKDGIPGTNGVDGKTTYFHVKYSNVESPTVEQMTEVPSKYIGTYVDYTEEDSENPSDYKWVKFTGDDGIPGTNGIDGKTHYLHIKYSNDCGQTFTDNNGEDPGEYLGVYTDEVKEDSTDVKKYTWSLIKGKDAITYYTWIKYADDDKGTNMSDDPDGKPYMGIAYNKEYATESTNPQDYNWLLVKGVDGINGANGQTYYTWIRYADDENGTNMSDEPDGKYYIGIAYNRLSDTESVNPSDYTWSLFRGSDGIDGQNGVAGKGIQSITEYYLATSLGSGVTTSTLGWDTVVPTISSDKKYLWNYEETVFVLEEYDSNGVIVTKTETDTTEPIIIGVYEKGAAGASLEIRYINSDSVPKIVDNNVSGWETSIPQPEDGKKTYMTQKLSYDTNWSVPVQISGTDGKDGSAAHVEINDDGYWVINGETTAIKAQGADGKTPTITITNGYWYINGSNSGIKAQGEAGKDGADIEFVYYRNNTGDTPTTPSYNSSNKLTTGWTQSPQGVTETLKYEFVSVRTKQAGSTQWGTFSTPVVWSKWGEKGQDGDGVEYKYYLKNDSTIPTYSASDTKWTDDPTGVSINNQYEYVMQIKTINGVPTPAQKASLWAKYGEDGQDGKDGTTYYTWIKYADTPTSGMSDDPSGKTYMGLAYNKTSRTESTNYNDYSWSLIRGEDGIDGVNGVDGQTYYTWVKYANDASGTGMSDSPSGKDYIGLAYNKTTPTESSNASDYTWALFKGSDGVDGTDGSDGVGVSSITNFYAVTEAISPAPSTAPTWSALWQTTPPAMTDQKKYLWNCEKISYTNGDIHTTTPAIIGIRGDNGRDGTNGTDAVDFQIYSVDGFEFSDNLTSITLKTVAIQNGKVVNGTKYQWSWWNKDAESGPAYEDISSATSSSITISDTSPYAFSDIKCTMTYDGNSYEDHAILTEKTVVYTSIVKFFDGSNMFHENDEFIVAYVELYQNNKKVDGANDVDKYYSSVVTVSSGVISGATGSFANGDKMYFIYQDGSLYKVVLGQYNSGSWRVVDTQQNYIYTNSLYPAIKSNIIAISKESINKSANIDFIIYKDNVEIARTSTNVIDSNDPIISSTKPTNAVHGQLWLDTSKTPHILWMYEKQNANDAGKWVECSEKIGGAVFTSQPNRYFAGDLWILGSNESCGNFGPGSMLKAIVDSSQYSASHWIDADADSTSLKNNIKQYLKFDANTGLRIGQTGDKFYVNISSTRMSFCDDASIKATSTGEVVDKNEVVSISNNAATIQSAKLKGNTEFYGQLNICDPKSEPTDNTPDTLFVWKIEQDGSLSLARA